MSNLDREDMNDNINSTDRHSDVFSDAIVNEDLGLLATYCKRYGCNFVIAVRQKNIRRSSIKEGLAILPLHLAASYRRVKSLESLLSAGADAEMRDQHGRTALHLVITHWPYILNNWAEPRTKFETAMSVVQQRAEACLEALCQHGVNIHAEVECDSRQTAVHLAVRYSALPALNILARHGAHVDIADRIGMTPLHMACGTLNRGLAMRLVSLGADLNQVVTHSGNTPLHMAALALATRSPRTLDADLTCIAELLDRGADPDTVNKTGRTALHEACGAGKEAVVDLLLSYGADLAKRTPRGENCLFLFLDRRHNVRETSLLGKLLCLTHPLNLYNKDGLLPGLLLLPQFAHQRDKLLDMSQRPCTLQNICKGHIYRTSGKDRRQALRDILPERIYDFVFNCWGSTCDVSFVRKSGEEPIMIDLPSVFRHFSLEN